MDLENNGKLIAEHRKQKGLTQKQLADALFVTDKAVSKWERGLSAPDHGIISKLASILDIDVEHLLQNSCDIESNWFGRLVINDKKRLYKKKINDQYLLEHMLVFFALVGIKNIEIECEDESFVNSLNLSDYGFNILLNKSFKNTKYMEIHGYFFLFGANMTRLLKYMMSSERNTEIMINDKTMPICLINNEYSSDEKDIKKFGRGYLYKEINSDKDLFECEELFETINNNINFPLNDLREILNVRKNK